MRTVCVTRRSSIASGNGFAIRLDHVYVFIQTNPYTLPTDIARLIRGKVASGHLASTLVLRDTAGQVGWWKEEFPLFKWEVSRLEENVYAGHEPRFKTEAC